MLHAAFQLVKHRVSPIDLVAVDTCSGRRLYSFLSVAWGIIADVDSESERFRSLGNARFTVGAVVRIIGRHASRLRCSENRASNCSRGVAENDGHVIAGREIDGPYSRA